MRRIESQADIADAVAGLIAADPRLKAVAAIAGPLPLRRRAAGFEGLAAIVTAQQISATAAASIWARLEAAVDPFTPEQFLLTPEEALRAAGLSRPKIRTLYGIAGALLEGFDLAALHDAPAEDAVSAMVSLNGIGPWTAEIYLLFCVGHPDVFPSGDLALQIAVGRGLGLDKRPSDKALREIASRWSPWRGIAARMFWAYYSAERRAAKGEKTSARSEVVPSDNDT